jgi:hypothetical protein
MVARSATELPTATELPIVNMRAVLVLRSRPSDELVLCEWDENMQVGGKLHSWRWIGIVSRLKDANNGLFSSSAAAHAAVINFPLRESRKQEERRENGFFCLFDLFWSHPLI